MELRRGFEGASEDLRLANGQTHTNLGHQLASERGKRGKTSVYDAYPHTPLSPPYHTTTPILFSVNNSTQKEKGVGELNLKCWTIRGCIANLLKSKLMKKCTVNIFFSNMTFASVFLFLS